VNKIGITLKNITQIKRRINHQEKLLNKKLLSIENKFKKKSNKNRKMMQMRGSNILLGAALVLIAAVTGECLGKFENIHDLNFFIFCFYFICLYNLYLQNYPYKVHCPTRIKKPTPTHSTISTLHYSKASRRAHFSISTVTQRSTLSVAKCLTKLPQITEAQKKKFPQTPQTKFNFSFALYIFT
jgi:hypothetical protein